MNQSAKSYFSRIFSNAELDEEDVKAYTEEAVESFEDDAKKSFMDSSKDYHISVGGRGFTDPKLRVRKGLMALKGYVSRLPSDILGDEADSMKIDLKFNYSSHPGSPRSLRAPRTNWKVILSK